MTSILGTGRAIPKRSVSNHEFEKYVDTSDEWIYTRTGIKSRYFAEDESSLDLCLEAAKQALEAANVSPEELDLIVVGSVSADHATPSQACEVMRALGASCPSFDINAACSGFLYGVIVAKALSNKRALVIGCEVLSKVLNFEDRTTCILFGDGAGAAVLGKDSGDDGEILAHRYMAHPDTKNSLFIPGINQGPEKDGGKSYVHMDGKEIYKFATVMFPRDIELLLEDANVTADDVEWFVPHQANIRIIQTASKKLKVPMDRFYVNIERFGNTSSASVAIALDELLRSGKTKKGDLIAMSAFGGGLTTASLLMRV